MGGLLLSVSLVGTIAATMVLVLAMREVDLSIGAIVDIALVHARRTSAEVASYAAFKATLASLIRSIAIEGQACGIRCNAILPGAIDTPLLPASPTIPPISVCPKTWRC